MGDCVHGALARRINIIEERLLLQGKMLKGRQMAWIVNNYYKLNEQDGALLEFSDILAVELRDNNLEAFLHSWEVTINSLRKIPGEEVLEDVFRKQLRRC